MRGKISVRAALTGAILLSAACGDSTSIAVGDSVSLNFRVATTGAAAVGPSRVAGPQRVAGPPMAIEGTNGTLTLDEVLLIVNEAELRAADGSCGGAAPTGGASATDGASGGDDPANDRGSGDGCEGFDAPPRLLDLPLDGQPVSAVTATIPAGTYSELDFEIDDLEHDKSDATDAAAIDALRSDILASIADWPDEASAMITGTFTAAGGSAVAFRVFLKAEIEVEMALDPNLVVDDAGGTNRDLTVDIAPQKWFTNADGTVLDLTQYDYDTTQQLLEFEVEMEHGFAEVEVDD